MVRLRMQRHGRKNRPFYRISAIDGRTRRDGKVIEQLGWFDPFVTDPAKSIELNLERVQYWLKMGAQPSDTVRDFLAKRGVGDLKAWEKERARQRKVVADHKAKADAGAAAAAAAGEKKDEKKA